jgi:rhamnose transport system permease protein
VLGLLILLAVASDAVILQRLRTLWGGAEMKLVTKGVGPASGEQGVSRP